MQRNQAKCFGFFIFQFLEERVGALAAPEGHYCKVTIVTHSWYHCQQRFPVSLRSLAGSSLLLACFCALLTRLGLLTSFHMIASQFWISVRHPLGHSDMALRLNLALHFGLASYYL